MKIKVNSYSDKDAGGRTSYLAEGIITNLSSLDTSNLEANWSGEAKDAFFESYNAKIESLIGTARRLSTLGDQMSKYVEEINSIDAAGYELNFDVPDKLAPIEKDIGDYVGKYVQKLDDDKWSILNSASDEIRMLLSSDYGSKYWKLNYGEFEETWNSFGIYKSHHRNSTVFMNIGENFVDTLKYGKLNAVKSGVMDGLSGLNPSTQWDNVMDVVGKGDDLSIVGKASKGLEVLGFVGDIIELGAEGFESYNRNIAEGAGAEEIVSEMVVDVVVKGVGIGAGAAIGGAIGSLIPIPVVGTLVGAAAGIAVEMGIEAAMNIQIGDKTVQEHLRDGATAITEATCDAVGEAWNAAGEMASEAWDAAGDLADDLFSGVQGLFGFG